MKPAKPAKPAKQAKQAKPAKKMKPAKPAKKMKKVKGGYFEINNPNINAVIKTNGEIIYRSLPVGTIVITNNYRICNVMSLYNVSDKVSETIGPTYQLSDIETGSIYNFTSEHFRVMVIIKSGFDGSNREYLAFGVIAAGMPINNALLTYGITYLIAGPTENVYDINVRRDIIETSYNPDEFETYLKILGIDDIQSNRFMQISEIIRLIRTLLRSNKRVIFSRVLNANGEFMLSNNIFTEMDYQKYLKETEADYGVDAMDEDVNIENIWGKQGREREQWVRRELAWTKRENEAQTQREAREQQERQEREQQERQEREQWERQQQWERETREQQEREARVQQEREAQEQRWEREAQEQRWDRKAREQREREAREQREREAREQREREAREQWEREARAKQERKKQGHGAAASGHQKKSKQNSEMEENTKLARIFSIIVSKAYNNDISLSYDEIMRFNYNELGPKLFKKPYEIEKMKMINKKAALYLHPDKMQQNISVTLKDIKNKREVLFASSSDDELNRLIESAYKYIARLFTEAKEFIKLIEKRRAGGKIKSYKKAYNKVVLGKNRVIYKMDGSKKEYIKSKGMYISVVEYKRSKKS